LLRFCFAYVMICTAVIVIHCHCCVCVHSDPLFVKNPHGCSASEQRAGLAASFVILDAYARYELR
jgi:hypothetical protein